jgi:hypothetical protein
MKEVYVNPENVVSVRLDEETNQMLKEGALPWDLHRGQTFSLVTIQSGAKPKDITVVGSPSQIVEKCYASKTRLLKG